MKRSGSLVELGASFFVCGGIMVIEHLGYWQSLIRSAKAESSSVANSTLLVLLPIIRRPNIMAIIKMHFNTTGMS